LTKHLNDDLKCNLTIEDSQVEPALIDNTLVISEPTHSICKPKSTAEKTRVVKAKMTTKKTHIDEVTANLYDLEDSHGSEKDLNIDLGLYQMEDF
jgi:hypothetical protein